MRYWGRVGSMMATHPLEMLERVRQRTEMWRHAHEGKMDYDVDPDWERELERRLPAEERSDDGWDEVLSSLENRLADFPSGHDADVALARSIWQSSGRRMPRRSSRRVSRAASRRGPYSRR